MQGKGLSHSFARYVTKQRWMSYYYQIKECVDSTSKSILVIGKGDGIVPVILKQVLEREKDAAEIENTIIDTFDYDDRLHPTYVGDIRDLSRIVKKKYDCVICCQVLEHLPWDCFESIVQNIKSICNYKFILSLPLNRRSFQMRLDICHLTYRFINIVIERKWVKNFPYKGEHYWEAGIKGHTKKDILYIIKKYYDVENDYVIPENTYHWFVICHV
ncbi:MAG: class I SAM-dependent methyltransferase [Lachnospiraceae bacterium]|nr:class I SAM-dependent methyltransferase [Lachnospiraceae bacterium]